MKLSVEINGLPLSIAEIKGKGHLGTHLNMVDRQGTGKAKTDIFVSGYDINDNSETKYLNWKKQEVHDGDTITIRISPEKEADVPGEVKSSIKDKEYFNVTSDQAESIIRVAYACNEQLNRLLFDLKSELSESEYKKIAFGVGKNISEVFDSLLDPVFRKYPEKRPESLKDMPL